MAWATAADCAAITGVTPDAATLALAQASIEDHVNRAEDSTAALYPRDLHWLRRAVAWQAAWLPSQHDYLSRTGVQVLTQDGMSVQFRTAADQLIAPHAQRALRNLSWHGPRTVNLTGAGNSTYSQAADARWLNEATDDDHGWDGIE